MIETGTSVSLNEQLTKISLPRTHASESSLRSAESSPMHEPNQPASVRGVSSVPTSTSTSTWACFRVPHQPPSFDRRPSAAMSLEGDTEVRCRGSEIMAARCGRYTCEFAP
jgi:hypothetical protein